MKRYIYAGDYNKYIFFLFQRSQVLGNKIEMEITQLIEKNPTILRLGLHLEYNDARHRIATHLQRNIDTSKYTEYCTFFLHNYISFQQLPFFVVKNFFLYKFF